MDLRLEQRSIDAALDCAAEFFVELGTAPQAGDLPPLHRESIQGDLAELIDEVWVRGILAGGLDADAGRVRVAIEPRPSGAGALQGIAVRLEDERGGSREQVFRHGPWLRRAQAIALRLCRAGGLPEGRELHVRLRVEVGPRARAESPFLQAPEIAEGTLEELGVRSLGAGELDPARAVLVNARALEELLALTERAGALETGGAMLGRIVRLPEPLAGSATRIVTVLTAFLADQRHRGEEQRFTFSPAALAEAARTAELRCLGERVLTAAHSHGWGAGCNRCNHDERCALPPCTEVSLDDYRVCDSLFPGKATLLPIAGRQLGASGERPVLALHAWLGGALRPIRWRSYSD